MATIAAHGNTVTCWKIPDMLHRKLIIQCHLSTGGGHQNTPEQLLVRTWQDPPTTAHTHCTCKRPANARQQLLSTAISRCKNACNYNYYFPLPWKVSGAKAGQCTGWPGLARVTHALAVLDAVDIIKHRQTFITEMFTLTAPDPHPWRW